MVGLVVVYSEFIADTWSYSIVQSPDYLWRLVRAAKLDQAPRVKLQLFLPYYQLKMSYTLSSFFWMGVGGSCYYLISLG